MSKAFPRTLRIRDGLSRKGKLQVIGPDPDDPERWVVKWEAQTVPKEPLKSMWSQWVYDCESLTSKSIADWTGIDLSLERR